MKFTLSFFIWTTCYCKIYAENESVKHSWVSVDAQKPIHVVNERYLSVALESAIVQHHWKTFNTSSPKLLYLASALSPCYLRMGGTSADFLLFDPGRTKESGDNGKPVSLEWWERGAGHHKNYTNFTMSGEDWHKINKFVVDVGWRLLFDLNVLLVRNGEWDPSNAIELLKYSVQRNYTDHLDLELANEPDSFKHAINRTLNATQLGQDFLILHHLIRHWPPMIQPFRTSFLVGPDLTRPKKKSLTYLKDYLSVVNHTLDAITWHQYYMDGRTAKMEDFINVTVLDYLHSEINEIKRAVRKAGYRDSRLWLGETGSAWGGGAPGLSDTYVAGFLWLDKLGLAAKMGLDVVIRQSLYSGHYSMITDKLQPLPDYWLSVLYKHLVGRRVLKVTNAQNQVRVYCHCTQHSNTSHYISEVYPAGAVTMYVLNLKREQVTLNLSSEMMKLKKHQFLLTPHGEGGLKSKHVNLNGHKLTTLSEGRLPLFRPKTIPARKPLFIPALSYGFFVIPSLQATACL